MNKEIEEARLAKIKRKTIETYINAIFDDMKSKGMRFVIGVAMPGGAVSIACWGQPRDMVDINQAISGQIGKLTLLHINRQHEKLQSLGVELEEYEERDE